MEIREIKDLAKRIMIGVNDEEAKMISEDFKKIDEQLKLLNKIDTEGVEEMVYPFDVITDYLRTDEADHVLSKEDALSNVDRVKEGHFVVPKVVK